MGRIQPSVHTERIGVLDVQRLVHRDLRWLAREQPIVDYGIDAHIEVVADGDPTGQLIAVQVRSRERPFDRIDGGWMVRDSLEHLGYWLGHVLPVIMVIYDVQSERAYWQRITPHTALRAGNGFKIEVPESQPLDGSAQDALREIAARDDDRALERFATVLAYLPSPCADALEKAHTIDPLAAARVAVLLADGRAQPDLTAQSILAAPPRGMVDESWRLWQAIGSYAAEHEVPVIAAQALERAAAHADPAPRTRFLGLAACLLAEAVTMSNRDVIAEAGRLIEVARADDPSNLLADLAETVLDAGTSGGDATWAPRTWVLPSSIRTLPESQLASDSMLGIAVGDESLIAGDIEAAVRRYSKAVEATPASSGGKIKLAHALTRRATTRSHLAAADYDDAERHAREALADRRRWGGPSEHALEMLLHILLARSAFSDALNEARMDPSGVALPREACVDAVRVLGARAALALGRLEIADEIASGVSDPLKSSLISAWRSEADIDANADSRREAWQAAVPLAVEAKDPTALMVVAQRLATLGVWPVAGVDDAAAAGVLPPGLTRIMAAVAAAAGGRVEEAVKALRPLTSENILAVEQLAQILGPDRPSEAVTVCLQGADRFQAPHLRLLASQILLRSGDRDRATAGFLELLATHGLSIDAQRHIRLMLIELAFEASGGFKRRARQDG